MIVRIERGDSTPIDVHGDIEEIRKWWLEGEGQYSGTTTTGQVFHIERFGVTDVIEVPQQP